MAGTDLISIITPSYNSELFIEETYNSICSQTYDNWEWLVTDDCSSDRTWEILKKISLSNPKVKIFQNKENSGAAVSRNNSISHASGEYLAFIDSDDKWEPCKLNDQLHFMKTHDCNFCFTAYTLITEHGELLHKNIDARKTCLFVSYKDLLAKKVTLGCSTVMLKNDAFDNIRMPLIRTGQDYALWLHLLKKYNVNAVLYPKVLTSYRIVAGSISRNKLKKAIRQWSIYRNLEKINLVMSMWYFVNYAWRAISR
ncbi:glycosyltransferase family 2 protein [Enterobacter hormaechei]|uniref:glycosyltransferase family 2 protein n=1 Tax=Enterobacter hormaechei TaxID=158836 RepID=UPI001981388B|nr:glycosyltransferase family 2 protein [Enterobacter hormaechei]MBN4832042.1 glycosyltransferase family 2 protein [Enterobacter hormaechei]MCE1526482.1 glycosyltransferase [Enterobacter hormaechei]